MLHEQQLGITGSGKTVLKPSALLVFLTDFLLLSFRCIFATPGCTKRGVHDHQPHLLIREAVRFQSVGFLITHYVFHILSFDEHIRQTNGVGFGVDFLSKQAHIHIGIFAAQEIIGSGQHTTRTTGSIQHGGDFTLIRQQVVAALCQQHIDHQTNYFTGRIVITGLSVFRKAADNILENVAHFHTVYMGRVQIQNGELFNHAVKTVALIHFVDLGAEFQQLFQNQLDVGGKAFNVRLKIGRNAVAVIQKAFEVVFTIVVKRILGNLAKKRSWEVGVLLVLCYNCIFGSLQSTLKPADDDHRDNNILVFIRGIGTTEGVGNGPDQSHFFAYVNGRIIIHNFVKILISHFTGSPSLFF